MPFLGACDEKGWIEDVLWRLRSIRLPGSLLAFEIYRDVTQQIPVGLLIWANSRLRYSNGGPAERLYDDLLTSS